MRLSITELIFKVLFSCFILYGICFFRAGQLEQPQSFSSEHWVLERAEGVNAGPPRTFVRSGVLELGYYAFQRTDQLILSNVDYAVVQLSEDSQACDVLLKYPQGFAQIQLSSRGWKRTDQSSWNDEAFDTRDFGSVHSMKITPRGRGVKIVHLEASGSTLDVQEMYLWSWCWLIVPIFVSIYCLQTISVVILSVPIWCWLSFTHWSYLAEQLYLTQSVDVIALNALILSYLPLLMAGVLSWVSLFSKGGDSKWSFLIWIPALLFYPSFSAWLSIVILGFSTFKRRYGWLGGLFVLGGPFGILCGWLWSFGCFVRDRHRFLQDSPRTGANILFVLLLVAPLVVEWSLRESSLARGWSSEVLSGEVDSEDKWRQPKPFWSEQCGENVSKRIVFLGGSSTGGAYQFKDHPELFFSAQTHRELCRNFGVQSFNYGAAERDSFTIARTMDLILTQTKANWIVLYIGHNDFTADNPYTRKEREEMKTGFLGRLLTLSSQSRLIRGANLLLRSRSKPTEHLVGAPLGSDGKPMRSQVMNQEYPFAVPLKDAEENIEQIAQVAKVHGAQVLLVAQLISSSGFQQLTSYWDLEQRLSQKLDNVHYLDPRTSLMKENSEKELLVDNNHLSSLGHRLLGHRIAIELQSLKKE
ncbi:MAG: hypothetical protein CMK59_03500 [Proteobacteria bacterium]|nr:hypothetical protein [Pseudomonadota bacterium]